MPKMSAVRFGQLFKRVEEALEKQGVDPTSAYVSLEPSINGIRVDVVPYDWDEKERLGAHEDGDPQPEHLGYW